jgi:iron complex outermembrane receptor protein
MKKFLLIFMCFFYFASVRAQSTYYFDPLIVTASRIYSGLPVDLARETLVLNHKDIEKMPVSSVSSLFRYIGNIDLQNRGTGGIQADFGIRGSSFDQVLVLIDGMRINDPQTGHHNSDIPVLISDIDRIEVLSGHASSLYGSDGFGGVIHILTKNPVKHQTYVKIMGGNFGTISGEFSQTFRTGPLVNRFGIKKAKSDGYLWDTEYDNTTASLYSSIQLKNMILNFSSGYTLKDFGANGFYAPLPSTEETSSFYGLINMECQLSSVLGLKSNIFKRNHDDYFILDLRDPSYYQNTHTSILTGGGVQANLHLSKNTEIVFGVDALEEKLESTRLGHRERFRTGIFSEVAYLLFRRVILNGGVRADYENNWELEINPTLSLFIPLNKTVSLRGSVGRVFRAPNFTELYYESDYNIGNSRLRPEYGWCWEIGFNHRLEHQDFTFSVFGRNERNHIDWIAENIGDPWYVSNIGKVMITGFTTGIEKAINRYLRFRLNYTWIDRLTSKNRDYYSKYGFNVLRHNLKFAGFIKWTKRINQSILLNIKKRAEAIDYLLLDTQITYRINKVTLYLDLTNLFNTSYEEVPGVPMPGRAIMTGGALNL